MIHKLLMILEKIATYYQGKGWGSSTVKHEVEAILQLYPKGRKLELFIDIGGNEGEYSRHFNSLSPGTSIIIFEPSKTNLKILNEKFLNHNNILIEPFAVSNSTFETKLYSDVPGSGSGSLTRRRLDHFGISFDIAENVSVIKFEDYWEEKLSRCTIDIVKLDIEGHELDALRGFGNALKSVALIQFEFGGCNIDTRTYFQDFWYFFKDNNFELYRITPVGVIKVKNYRELDETFVTTNYIAKNMSI